MNPSTAPAGWYSAADGQSSRWRDGYRWTDVFLVDGHVAPLEKMRRNARAIIVGFAALSAVWIVSMVVAAATMGPVVASMIVPMGVIHTVTTAIMSA
jgi:hypothetical protein